MKKVKLKKLLSKIVKIRPGSMTKEFKYPKRKPGPYSQINYTLKMKTRTEYVPRSTLEQLAQEDLNMKVFKPLLISELP